MPRTVLEMTVGEKRHEGHPYRHQVNCPPWLGGPGCGPNTPRRARQRFAPRAFAQAEHGLPRDAVYEALPAAGIPRRVNRYGAPIMDRVPAEVVEQVVARYLAGASVERVAP
jgi:hypothetical protein